MAGTGARLKRRGKPSARKDQGVPWGLLSAAAVIVAGGVGFLLYVATSADTLTTRSDAAADRFQLAHWVKPIPLQGPPPSDVAVPARGLLPENCALCHMQQYTDWRGSLHAKSMGPGVLGQFPSMSFAGQATCLECHAPLSEQWASLPNGQGGYADNAAYDAPLSHSGLTCAGCHLRKHQRFGPPTTPLKAAFLAPQASAKVHGPAVRTTAFRASEFCKGCHQHATTTVLINGKTVENTYREWLESRYAAAGMTCQGCHMPAGRHLWRGIHDPQLTRSGVTIEARVEPQEPRQGAPLQATLTLRNTNTGHAFPTYTTPAVYLRAAFLDATGQVLAGQFSEHVIQRRLNMSTSPWGEDFDTRVLPDQSAELTFSATPPSEARTLYLWVWVEPDQFYNGFFRSRLQGSADFAGREQLQAALRATEESPYLLFGKKLPIQGPQ